MTRRNGFVTVVVLVMALVLAILSVLLVKTFALEFAYLSHADAGSTSAESCRTTDRPSTYSGRTAR